MPVTAKLSRSFYERLGDNVANELVEWFNAVDSTYRADLMHLNDVNFTRFEARLDQRASGVESRLEQRMAELQSRLEQRITGVESRLEQKMVELESRIQQQMVELEARLEQKIVRLEARMDARFVEVETMMHSGFAQVDLKIARANSDLKSSLLVWMVGLTVTGLIANAAMIASMAR